MCHISYSAPALVAPSAPTGQRLRLRSDISSARAKQIAEAHCGYTGHPGINATIAILKNHGHKWRGMTAQVAQFIAKCPTCCLARITLNPAQAAVSTIRFHGPPLKRWHSDSTGKLEECRHTGFNRISIFVCESTGYTVLEGSRFGSALEIVIGLVKLVGTFGLFESFHSDGGSENDAYILHQFMRLTGIRHTNAVAYNPQTNGIAEAAIKTVKRFMRTMIADGLMRHNAWGLMLPIIQQAINSMPSGPLRVAPNSVIFASLYVPDSFVIPTTYHRQGLDIADANEHPPAANFVTRAASFQQHVTNLRHEILMTAMDRAERLPDYDPETIAVGQQVLIPWNQDRRPSSLHPHRRGPYIVTRNEGNVLHLSHAISPLPDSQEPFVRWSRTAQIYTLDAAFDRDPDDPSAVNSPTPTPIQRAIECVLSFSLIASYRQRRVNDDTRLDVRNQLYSCRLFQDASTADHDRSNYVMDFFYEDIRHTLAFESFIANHPMLTGHTPIASMPMNWDPRALIPSLRPAHYPVIAPERSFPVEDPLSEVST